MWIHFFPPWNFSQLWEHVMEEIKRCQNLYEVLNPRLLSCWLLIVTASFGWPTNKHSINIRFQTGGTKSMEHCPGLSRTEHLGPQYQWGGAECLTGFGTRALSSPLQLLNPWLVELGANPQAGCAKPLRSSYWMRQHCSKAGFEGL